MDSYALLHGGRKQRAQDGHTNRPARTSRPLCLVMVAFPFAALCVIAVVFLQHRAPNRGSREAVPAPTKMLRSRSACAPTSVREDLPATRTCNCPPSNCVWACSEYEERAVLNGSTCPYYARTGGVSRSVNPHSSSEVEGVYIGGDAVTHGCISSAGYRWCATKSSCIRVWEHGLRSESEFAAACELKPAEIERTCNCPPSFALWACSDDEYQAVLNGSTCTFYMEQHVPPRIGDAPSVSVLPGAAVGGDSDSHGCIPSAGYRWCATKSSCIRMWEHGLLSEGDFSAACAPEPRQHHQQHMTCNCPPSLAIWTCTQEEADAIRNGTSCAFYRQESPLVGAAVGGDSDRHGCIPSAGYQWCAAKSACIRAWEHNLHTEEGFSLACAAVVAEQQRWCSCPPALVLWSCTEEQERAVLNGSTCEYYRGKP